MRPPVGVRKPVISANNVVLPAPLGPITAVMLPLSTVREDRKSTRLNSSHTVIYTLSLHDALPISAGRRQKTGDQREQCRLAGAVGANHRGDASALDR